VVPASKLAEQLGPQSIPGCDPRPLLVTQPRGVGEGVMSSRATVNVGLANETVTDVLAVRTNVQVDPVVAAQGPLQPVTIEPAAGVADSWTVVPQVNGAAHVVPQSMPAGALVTVPAPCATPTVSVTDGSKGGGAALPGAAARRPALKRVRIATFMPTRRAEGAESSRNYSRPARSSHVTRPTSMPW
jgi:hypothetical protein